MKSCPARRAGSSYLDKATFNSSEVTLQSQQSWRLASLRLLHELDMAFGALGEDLKREQSSGLSRASPESFTSSVQP